MWDELLRCLSEDRRGGSPEMLAKVLTRVALADGPVPRSAISKGSMLFRPSTLASGTVGKAVDALKSGKGLLTEEVSTPSGKPGPQITPLRFSDKWAIVGLD